MSNSVDPIKGVAGTSYVKRGAAKTKQAVSKMITCELVIPNEAVGRIIGTQQVHLKMLRQLPNISKIQIKDIFVDMKVLIVSGDEDAVAEVINAAQKSINTVEMNSHNKTRATHKYKQTPGGLILTPRDLHQNGQSSTTKGSNYHGKKQDQNADATFQHKKDADAAGIDIPNTALRAGSKKQKELDADFAAAKERFEEVKAARSAKK